MTTRFLELEEIQEVIFEEKNVLILADEKEKEIEEEEEEGRKGGKVEA
jgi:hypothetical protein